MNLLSSLWNAVQGKLFPFLEEEMGELSNKEKQFVHVCELCALEKHVLSFDMCRFGRPRKERLCLAMAFVAKAVYNFSKTKILIDYLRNNATLRRLCGWETKREIPSESTFSRSFAEFANGELPQIIHENMVKKYGLDISCTLIVLMETFRLVPFYLLHQLTTVRWLFHWLR